MCNQCYGPSRALIGELEDIIVGAAAPLINWRTMPKVVFANRQRASEIHWGCFNGENVRASADVLILLGLAAGATPDERDWANAIAAWQNTNGLPVTGILDAATWTKMLSKLTTRKFKPLAIPVIVGGKQLGIIEKTKPYETDPNTAEHTGGALIEFGFRITDPVAVTKAGFTATDGRPPFRWMQVFQISNILDKHVPPGIIRKHSELIDPSTALHAPVDENPYYWDEEPPTAAHRGSTLQEIDREINRPATNRLCYDLMFWDQPSAPNNLASPGRRFYFNVETALVGIKQGDPFRNTVLDTITWGYDLVSTKGTTEIRLNHLGPGVKGGSPMFRKILSQHTADFPHHCFAGKDLAVAARCS